MRSWPPYSVCQLRSDARASCVPLILGHEEPRVVAERRDGVVT